MLPNSSSPTRSPWRQVWKRVPSVWPFHQVKNWRRVSFMAREPADASVHILWRRSYGGLARRCPPGSGLKQTAKISAAPGAAAPPPADQVVAAKSRLVTPIAALDVPACTSDDTPP